MAINFLHSSLNPGKYNMFVIRNILTCRLERILKTCINQFLNLCRPNNLLSYKRERKWFDQQKYIKRISRLSHRSRCRFFLYILIYEKFFYIRHYASLPYKTFSVLQFRIIIEPYSNVLRCKFFLTPQQSTIVHRRIGYSFTSLNQIFLSNMFIDIMYSNSEMQI